MKKTFVVSAIVATALTVSAVAMSLSAEARTRGAADL